jgi:hypothetical protein
MVWNWDYGAPYAPTLDHPEPGATFYSCSFKVRDLPEPYVGGHLTTSTISSDTRGRVGPAWLRPAFDCNDSVVEASLVDGSWLGWE